ncbi:MAG: DUF4292 domain-containing protein [Catalinimonas sp.]
MSNLPTTSRPFVVLFFLLLAVSACKRPTGGRARGPLDSTALGMPLAPEIRFDYLTSRARFSYAGEEQNLNASATIRIDRDSMIWVSVSPGLGIEVLRVLIRPDSVFAVDRYHRKSYRYDYPTLARKLEFEVNYDMLQAALLGNLPFPRRAPKKLIKGDAFYILRQRVGKLEVENYVDIATGTLNRVVTEEEDTRNTMEVNYREYDLLEGGLFPYETTLLLMTYDDATTAKTEIDVRHQRVDVTAEAPSFSFSFPEDYEIISD